MRQFLHNNSLSIILFALFAFSFAGQIITGFADYNDERKAHHHSEVSVSEYFTSGHFIEATFENWESEFLQMGMYVVLTIFLFQKGSSQSRKPGVIEGVDIIPETARSNPKSPYPVRRGGWLLKLYQNSLSIALFALFAISFALHAYGGAREYNEEQRDHGEAQVSTLEFMETSQFWFQSFQNWQSEFLSIGAMIMLSIYLRQKGSPESKPVDAPHDETGD